MNGHGVVDENFRDTGILRHNRDELELFIEGFFFMGHRLPFRPFADFFHFVGRARSAKDFATVGRFDQKGVDGITATGRVVGVFVVGAVESPFGGIIEGVFIDDTAGGVRASGEPVFHDDEDGITESAKVQFPRVGLQEVAYYGGRFFGSR